MHLWISCGKGTRGGLDLLFLRVVVLCARERGELVDCFFGDGGEGVVPCWTSPSVCACAAEDTAAAAAEREQKMFSK